MKTTIQNLKKSIITYVDYVVKANTQGNQNMYESIANKVWNEEVAPFVKNENITSWESDIKNKFCNNPYVKFSISEKQAYCLARAFAAINPETVIN
jgi:hypothetical protein